MVAKKKGDIIVKIFYGGTFIEKNKLQEAGICYPIKLEYYKTIYDNKFGIQIIKTQYIGKKVDIEKKDINYITSNEGEINNILNLFKQNQVTPLGAIDVLKDLKFQTIYY